MAVTQEFLQIVYETIGTNYLKDLQADLAGATTGHELLTEQFKNGSISADQYQTALQPITARVQEMQGEIVTFKDIMKGATEQIDVGLTHLQTSGLKLQDTLRLDAAKLATADLKAFEGQLQSTMVPLSSLQMSGLELQDSMTKSAGGTLNADRAIKQFSGSLHALSLGRPMYAIGDLSNAVNTLAASSTALAPYLTLISLGTVALGSAAISAYHHWGALKDLMSGGAISEEAARVKTLAEETAKLAKEAEGLSDKLNKAKGPKEQEYEKYAKETTKPLLDDREAIAEQAFQGGPHSGQKSAQAIYDAKFKELEGEGVDPSDMARVFSVIIDPLRDNIGKAIKQDVLIARGMVEKAIVEGNEGAIKDLAQFTSGHVRDVLEAATREGHERDKAANADMAEIENDEKLREKQFEETRQMREAQAKARRKQLDFDIKEVTEEAKIEDAAHKKLVAEADKASKQTVKNLHQIQKNIDADAKKLAHSIPNLAQHHERSVTGAPVTFIDREGTMRMKAPGHDKAHPAEEPPVQPSAEEIEAPWLTVAKLPTSRVPVSRVPVQRGQGRNRKRTGKLRARAEKQFKDLMHPPLIAPNIFPTPKGHFFPTTIGSPNPTDRTDIGGGLESLNNPFAGAQESLRGSLQSDSGGGSEIGQLRQTLDQAVQVGAAAAQALSRGVNRQEYSEDTLSNRGGGMRGRSGMDFVAGY